jgi:DNA-binding CsgD family transcriptional regulator
MTQEPGRLAGIGLTEAEERAYLMILGQPRVLRPLLASFLNAGEGELAAWLDRLTSLRLVQILPGDPPRYVANRPDAAVGALMHRKLAALEEVRMLTDELSRQFEATAADPLLAEVVSPEPEHPVSGIHAVYMRLLDEATFEVAGIDGAKEPDVVEREEIPAEAPALRRGVAIRGLYSLGQMLMPGRLANLRALAGQGEQGRVSVRLPHMLFVFDRRTALLPPTAGDALPDFSGVVVHDPTLVAVILWLFEYYWGSAAPVPGPAGESDSRDLVARLAAGMKDEEIAADLDLSVKTVRRRITALLAELGVTTRFEAGVAAARHGWI